MGIEKKVVFFLLALYPFFLFSQDCGKLDNTLTEKGRKLYLVSDNRNLCTLENLLIEARPSDTALVRMIMQKGEKDENYVDFFMRKGVSFSKIAKEDFYNLKPDSIKLSRKERRLAEKLNNLSDRFILHTVQDKPTGSISRKMTKPKFIKIQKKLRTSNPLLFSICPIYRYQEYSLIIYSVYSKGGIPFAYDICRTR